VNAYLDSEGSANEASMVAKSRNTSTTSILKKLQIIQHPASTRKPRQHLLPATLLLVAMREVDESVLQRELFFR
jgi:hypothetical protein